MNYFIVGFFVLVVLVALFFVIKYWGRLRTFYAEVQQEMAKVAWPGREDIIRSASLVFVVTILMTVVISLVDAVLGAMIPMLNAMTGS